VNVEVFIYDKPLQLRTASVPLRISNKKGLSLDLNVDTTPHIPQSVNLFDLHEFTTKYPQYASRNFADPGTNEEINILIGSDYIFDLLTNTPKILVKPGLHLVESIFGWLLVGRQPKDDSKSSIVLLSTKAAVEQLWLLDTIGITNENHSKEREEELALEQFYQNIKIVDKRYQIRWPWRSFPPNLPNNFRIALGQLRTQWQKYPTEFIHD